MSLRAIVLAAGKGTRMGSEQPKVLQPLAGEPLVKHVIRAAKAAGVNRIRVVVGHQGERVRAALAGDDIDFVEQATQRGTGDAVARAMGGTDDSERILVLFGDTPMVTAQTLQSVISNHAVLTILSAVVPNPHGYGRIVRNTTGDVEAIVEQCDADAATREINEINTGILCAPAAKLKRWLAQLDSSNAQGELLLTDVVALARRDDEAVQAVVCDDSIEAQGANDHWQLARLHDRYFQRRLVAAAAQGLRLVGTAGIQISGSFSFGSDCVLRAGCVIGGDNRFGDQVEVGPYCIVEDCDLATGTVVLGHCELAGVKTTGPCTIGPFARLRPGTQLDAKARVGNFVETKQAHLKTGAKANHLSYLGDAEIGERSNIGAGTITCNYDGANKHPTRIGDDAFVGSNSALVAPVVIGDGATVGAGTTLNKNAPAGELTVARVRQRSIAGWQRPLKKT